jgi:hypothetical protein
MTHRSVSIPWVARTLRAQSLVIGALTTLAAYHAIALVAGSLVPLSPPIAGRQTAQSVRLAQALRECERRLSLGRARIVHPPRDGQEYLRVAFLEMQRARLLALLRREERGKASLAPEEASPGGEERGQDSFPPADPGAALKGVAAAAEQALRRDLDVGSRRAALQLLATARTGLGDHAAAAVALGEAAREEPKNARLWLRLAEAHARARQFRHAQAAYAAALACLSPTAARPVRGTEWENRDDTP